MGDVEKWYRLSADVYDFVWKWILMLGDYLGMMCSIHRVRLRVGLKLQV